MNGIDVALLVAVLTLTVAAIARQLPVPTPIWLAIAGIAVGLTWHLLPVLPPVQMPPDLVLLVFLPPLLTSAAYELPLGGFVRNLRPIAMLAIGLVLVTVALSAVVAHLVVGIPWSAAFVLGAIIAPPDPVAATSIAGRAGLSHRLVTVLEGEGLVNDASAIVVYTLALEAATIGGVPWDDVGRTLLTEVPLGVLVGLAVGWIAALSRRRLDDVTLEVGISLLVPYLTYEVADRLHASGVLAVVTLGFMLQRHSEAMSSPVTRLATRVVWGSVRFASTALVFFLLGVLIGEVVARSHVSWAMLAAGGIVAAAVIAVRLAWVHAVPTAIVRATVGARDPLPTRRELTVLGWAGMRGVVSLALALALPTLPGSPAPGGTRDAVILITFAVIVATLVVQGSTLGPLIRRLQVGDPERDSRDERMLRARGRVAGLAALMRAGEELQIPPDRCGLLAGRIASGELGIAGSNLPAADSVEGRMLLHALDAQRMVLDRMRDAGRVGEQLSQRLAVEIDADATRVLGETARLTGSEED